MIVVNHTVTQKLNNTGNNRRSHLSRGTVQVLADNEFCQPVPAQLRLGRCPTGHLQKTNFSITFVVNYFETKN